MISISANHFFLANNVKGFPGFLFWDLKENS